VGGSLRSNPAAIAGLQIANVDSAVELAQLMAAVGLAQNFAALRALVTDGIQKGHMRLHARSVAASANTPAELFDRVVAEMVASGEVKDWKARELIASLGNDKRSGAPIPDADRGGVTGFASGKVIMLGEHAVVYDKHALALPLPDAVAATVAMCDDGIHLSIPAWNYQRSFSARATTNDGVSAAVSLLLRRLNAPDQGFRIDVESRIPAGMGLGSSASLVVAITRAIATLLKLGLDDEAINSIAFECEKLAHGTPSGVDNTLAVYGQPVLYRKGARPSVKVLALSETPPLVIASSHQRGATKDQVAGVRRRFERNEALYGTIFDEIDEMSVAGASALAASDYKLLGSLMNVCHGMLNALQVSTPELESMVDIARRNGALGAKLTGAGGGGSIVALCPNTIGDVAHALRSAGYQIVRTTAPGFDRR
jgi:hydroxymethylglutaryl-CoA reductase